MRFNLVHAYNCGSRWEINITILGRGLKIDLGGIHCETVVWQVPKYAYSIHNYT